LVEQLICNQKVVGSIPIAGTRIQPVFCAAQKLLDESPLALYSSLVSPTRGGAVWQLVGLITRRSQVQILPPQPKKVIKANHLAVVGFFAFGPPE
jgi:hypothetical protein